MASLRLGLDYLPPGDYTGRVASGPIGTLLTMGGVTGSAKSITVYLQYNGQNPISSTYKVRCAVYNSDGVLVTNGETEERTLAGRENGWYKFNFTTSPTLNADAQYYFVVWSELNLYDVASFYVRTYNNNSLNVYAGSQSYASNFPSNVSFGLDALAYEVALYLTYDEVATTGESPISGTFPLETFASGYLTRYQRRQMVGYNRVSGDLRGIEVSNSGHVMIDSDVANLSGQWVNGISGVYVSQVSTYIGIVDINEGTVSFSGNILTISSGLKSVISGEVVHKGGASTLRVSSLKNITNLSGGEEICGTFCSGPVFNVSVKSLSGNEDMFIGHVDCKPYSGYGYLLSAEETKDISTNNVCNIWACANYSGNRISYLGENY